MNIGERLIQLRSHLGMTQAELGGKIGFTGSHISKLERGLTEPSDEILFSICNVTSARFEWLKNGEGQMFDEDVPPVDYASVGERIREARKTCGYTQKELAEKVKCTYEMVSKAELGKLTPSDRWLKKVAKECHVSLQWLLTGHEEEQTVTDHSLELIADYLRNNEIARIAITEDINSDDNGIWIRLEQLVRERKQEG